MNTSELGWRRFDFFKRSDDVIPSEHKKYFKDKSIRCWQCSIHKSYALLGEQNGDLFKISPTFKFLCWKLYQKELIALSLVDIGHTDVVATIGKDDQWILKIWDISGWEDRVPHCYVSIPIKNISSHFAVSVGVSPDKKFIVVGFADGGLYYSCGDVTDERSRRWKNMRDGVLDLPNGVLFGLATCQTGPELNVVFAVFSNGVMGFVVKEKVVQKTQLLDAKEILENCWFFNAHDNQLVVGNRETVYIYDADRALEDGFEYGRCLGLARGLEKVCMVGGSSYIAVVTKPISNLPGKVGKNVLTVYDIDCRCVSYMNPVDGCQLFIMNDNIYALFDSNGSISAFIDSPTSDKLNLVVQKDLYDVAIVFARRANSPELPHIQEKYATYLYQRGDFQNAVQHYTETIGYLEPSQVIKLFMDGTRAPQLALYLEAVDKRLQNLSASGLMLLLGAYVKMDAKEKAASLIGRFDALDNENIDTIVKLLRATGHFDLAKEVTKKFRNYVLLFAIMIEDLGDYSSAVTELSQIEGMELYEILEAYGRTMIEKEEDRVFDVIKRAVSMELVNIPVLLKLLNSRPAHLKSLYDQANPGVKRNVAIRNAIIEHLLERVNSKEIMLPPESFYELVNDENYEDALCAAQLHNYTPLVIYVLRIQKRYGELLRYLLRVGQIHDVMQECDSKSVSDMWMELLAFIAQSADIDQSNVVELLKILNTTKSVSPMIVCKLLSENKQIMVASVKQYVEEWIRQESENIGKHVKEIEIKTKEATELEQELAVYNEKFQSFQSSKCAACHNPLQHPSVHFFCKHSYHSHCYESHSDKSQGCPLCESSHPVTFDDVQPTLTSFEQLDNDIHNCSNIMSVIAEYISKGLFDDKPVTDQLTSLHSLNPFNEPHIRSTNPFDED